MTDQSVIMNHTAEDRPKSRPATATAGPEGDKKSRILDSARQLLVKRGFQDIAMDDVAREAGVAKGTLFLYYKNKDELLSAVFAALVDQLGAEFEVLLASGLQGRELLHETVRVILAHFDRNQDFMSQFSAGRFPACGARSCERLMEKFVENNRRLSRILAASLPELGGKPKELSYESFALLGLCRGAMLDKLIAKSHGNLAGQADKVLRFFLNGVKGAA
jgi:TetR/AcrR family fatty acid metabolism transcriptional regulator